MARAKLKPGTKIEFVHRHRHKTGDEILELAKAEKIPLTRNRLTTIRWQLREQYGVTDSGSKPLKAKYKSKKGTKKTYKVKAKENGVDPARAHKAAQLRKLVFEMGYDEVRTIFLEFQEMHNRWS